MIATARVVRLFISVVLLVVLVVLRCCRRDRGRRREGWVDEADVLACSMRPCSVPAAAHQVISGWSFTSGLASSVAGERARVAAADDSRAAARFRAGA